MKKTLIAVLFLLLVVSCLIACGDASDTTKKDITILTTNVTTAGAAQTTAGVTDSVTTANGTAADTTVSDTTVSGTTADTTAAVTTASGSTGDTTATPVTQKQPVVDTDSGFGPLIPMTGDTD